MIGTTAVDAPSAGYVGWAFVGDQIAGPVR
jgi:hypothetical protein